MRCGCVWVQVQRWLETAGGDPMTRSGWPLTRPHRCTGHSGSTLSSSCISTVVPATTSITYSRRHCRLLTSLGAATTSTHSISSIRLAGWWWCQCRLHTDKWWCSNYTLTGPAHAHSSHLISSQLISTYSRVACRLQHYTQWLLTPTLPFPQISVSVSFVCLYAYLRNHISKLHRVFCACRLWPWLGPHLTALQCVMYFRFLRSTSCFHIMGTPWRTRRSGV